MFPLSGAAIVTKFETKACTHYFAAASKAGASIGLRISGSDIIVKQSTSATVGNEYAALNAKGVGYFTFYLGSRCKCSAKFDFAVFNLLYFGAVLYYNEFARLGRLNFFKKEVVI